MNPLAELRSLINTKPENTNGTVVGMILNLFKATYCFFNIQTK